MRARFRPETLAEVVLTHIDLEGRVHGWSGGEPVVVSGGVPGSRVLARLGRRRRGLREAHALQTLDPGPLRRPARCQHAGTCGGCAFQELDYAAQLDQLWRAAVALLDAHHLLAGAEVKPPLACDPPFRYRNKVDYTFSNRRWVEAHEPEGVQRGFALGFHRRGSHRRVLDIARCELQFEEADGLLHSARDLARELGLVPWDTHAHCGLLRHLVLRKAFATGEVMVNLVTSEPATELLAPWFAGMLARHPEITTLVQNVHRRAAAIAAGETEIVRQGPGVIREELLGVEFEISANSFFQTNPRQASRLFEELRAEIARAGRPVVYDLYCGAGAISLVVAEAAAEVVGFELVPAAIQDARRNAARNRFSHVRFIEGDVRATLAGGSTGELPPPGIVLLDPPRPGLHPSVLRTVLDLAAPKILYLSCNVKSAARDLGPLVQEGGYSVQRIQPADLFPHTPHLEVLFALERA